MNNQNSILPDAELGSVSGGTFSFQLFGLKVEIFSPGPDIVKNGHTIHFDPTVVITKT